MHNEKNDMRIFHAVKITYMNKSIMMALVGMNLMLMSLMCRNVTLMLRITNYHKSLGILTKWSTISNSDKLEEDTFDYLC